MERARKGAKMNPGKDPTESMFGAFRFHGTNWYRDEHNREGQGHDRVSGSAFSRDLGALVAGRWEGRQLTHLLHNMCSLSSERKGR